MKRGSPVLIARRPQIVTPPRRQLIQLQPTSIAARPDELTQDPASATDGPSASEAATEGTRSGLLAYAIRVDQNGRWHLAPAWPLWSLLVAFPFWWAMGLGSFIFPIMAVPMALYLLRNRPIKVPPAFWLWALFLVWTVLGLVMNVSTSTNARAGSPGGRLLSTAVLLIEYGGITITLLFVGNLSERDLPIRRLVRWLGVLFMITVAGGLLGTYDPKFSFTSPLELVLPQSLRSNGYISALVHPNAAQVQSVLGEAGGRAAAPFGYTNYWANNLSILLIWFVVAWFPGQTSRRRTACLVIGLIALVPTVYSLNRGLWLAVALTAVWIAVRAFLEGRVLSLLALLAATSLGVVIFTLTPLHSVYQSRLNHSGSADLRSFLTTQALKGAEESPILGWGGARKTVGSNSSIAVGPTAKCPQCGGFPIGSNGEFWTLIYYNGFVGAAFFLGFFLVSMWVYRRDRTPIGQGGVIAVGLTFVNMLFYSSVPAAATMTMISVGLLWRSHLLRIEAPAE